MCLPATISQLPPSTEMIRPGFLVLGAGFIMVALDFVWARFSKTRMAARSVEPFAS